MVEIQLMYLFTSLGKSILTSETSDRTSFTDRQGSIILLNVALLTRFATSIIFDNEKKDK